MLDKNTCQIIRLNQGCQTGDQIKLTLFVRFKTKLIRPNLEVTFTFHNFSNMDKFGVPVNIFLAYLAALAALYLPWNTD